MEIRTLYQHELETALKLIWNVFEEFEAPEYEEHGIKTFREFICFDNILEQFLSGKMCFWGAYQNDEMVGALATRDNSHISLFFVKKQFHRQGIGKMLFRELVAACKEKNITSITVNSSPYAVNIYRKLGFSNLDNEQTVNGIRFTSMIYVNRQNIHIF